MSQKLLLTYPHKEGDRGIDLAPLFLLKQRLRPIKIFVKFDFFTNIQIVLFVFTLNFAETRADSIRKELIFLF